MSNSTDNTDNTDNDLYSEYEYEYLLSKIGLLLSLLGFLINLFHLSVLIRKELRSLSVFILMISVCICDILYLFSKLIDNLNSIRIYRRTDYCYLYDSFLITIITAINGCIGTCSSFSSIWLVVLMAFYRSLSITFPLNHLIKNLTTPKNTLIVLLSLITIGCAWNLYPYFWIYVIFQRKPHHPCDFITDINATEPYQYSLMYLKASIPIMTDISRVDWFLMISQLILYAFFAFLLISSLIRTKNNQKNKKKDNTTKLVLAMTIVFFLSQIFHPMLNFVLDYIFPDYVMSTTVQHILIAIKSFLQIIHAASHCPLSFFMSTAYKDTVKRVFGVRKKMKVVSVTGSLTSKSSTTKN